MSVQSGEEKVHIDVFMMGRSVNIDGPIIECLPQAKCVSSLARVQWQKQNWRQGKSCKVRKCKTQLILTCSSVTSPVVSGRYINHYTNVRQRPKIWAHTVNNVWKTSRQHVDVRFGSPVASKCEQQLKPCVSDKVCRIITFFSIFIHTCPPDEHLV